MRGEDGKQEAMFSYVSPGQRVPADHPLRSIRAIVGGILKEMSPQFASRYSDVGRPSIVPGAAVAGPASADFLFREERTAVDGTAVVQLTVPVVRRDGDGRGGVEPEA